MKSRYVFLPLFFAALGFSGFLGSAGADHVRAVQIVGLIATGMCLGVALANLRLVFHKNSQS